MAGGARTFFAGAAAGLLFATSARALLSTLFYLSLATLRLNATALGVLVLLSPLLLPLLRGRAPWALLVAGLAAAALPFARLTPAYAPVAGLALGAATLALAGMGRVGLLGALAGLLVDGALLLAGGTHDPLLAPWGAPVLAALGAFAVWAPRASGADSEPATVPAGLAWGALLSVEFAFLASPPVLERHLHDVPAWAACVASLVGLAVGLLALGRARPAVLLALGAVGLLDVAVTRSPLVLLSLAAAQAALGAAAARLAAPGPVALGVALAAGLFALLFFGAALGPYEWGAAMPLLALVVLLAAFARAPRLDAPRPPVLAAVLTGLLLLPGAAMPPRVEPHEGREIVVVSWNVHQGFGNRGALDPDAYVDALRALEPDVLLLQEVDTARLSSGGLDLRAYLARELGLSAHTPPSGVAILSRFPLAQGTRPEALGWTATAALDVHGVTLHARAVHLARFPQERAGQVDQVLARANASQGPMLLGGDVNSCPEATCFGGRPSDGVHARLLTAYRDAWTETHAEEDPSGYTHPSWSPRRRIDVVFVRGLDVLEAGPVRNDLTLLGSDHLPVVARVVVPSLPATSESREDAKTRPSEVPNVSRLRVFASSRDSFGPEVKRVPYRSPASGSVPSASVAPEAPGEASNTAAFYGRKVGTSWRSAPTSRKSSSSAAGPSSSGRPPSSTSPARRPRSR